MSSLPPNTKNTPLPDGGDEQTLDLTVPIAAPSSATSPSAADAVVDATDTMNFTPSPPTGADPSRAPSVAVTQRSQALPSTTVRPPAGPNIARPAPSASAMPYVIIRQHARGGLGVVNLARDEPIKREVALKQILPQHVSNDVLKRRFLYEARITGQLEHPSIVPVYALGTDDTGNPYYVMRFVKGRTLDEIIREYHTSPNPIVFRELLRRFIAVCQAVAYAHSRGVIHRDLKPANVMLGDYGETLVLDWGLAKDIKAGGQDPALWVDEKRATAKTDARPETSLSGQGGVAAFGTNSMNTAAAKAAAELTMEGQIIGTPAYMAPEQAEGKTELHGPVTDIYALGGILYKILTGQSPTAPTASTGTPGGTRRFTFVPSPPPASVNPAAPPILANICMRAMATAPELRYPRAMELSQDILRWLDEHPLTVRPRTSTGRLTLKLRENAVWIISLLIAGLLILAVLLLMRF